MAQRLPAMAIIMQQWLKSSRRGNNTGGRSINENRASRGLRRLAPGSNQGGELRQAEAGR